MKLMYSHKIISFGMVCKFDIFKTFMSRQINKHHIIPYISKNLGVLCQYLSAMRNRSSAMLQFLIT